MKVLQRYFLAAALSLVAALILSYLPDSGHGLLKDDFRWIVESRVRTFGDLGRVLLSDNGFYRPVVSLTFAVNEWLVGAWPKGYALTNFAILLLSCAAIFVLARNLRMSSGFALLAVGLWALNPHGISGLVMWISGRTSGLVTLFSVLAAIAAVTHRRALAALLCLLALLSKEEAFLLPVVLTFWVGWHEDFSRWSWRRAVARGWPMLFALVPYLVLRGQTHAFLPTTAPSYYRFVWNPLGLAQNIIQYADRAGTFTMVILLLMFLVVRRARRLTPEERGLITLGLAWLLGGFGISVFVPARSSLYACLPSVGVALIGATLARSIWSRATERARLTLAVASVLLPVALVPLLHSRNGRMRAAADLSNAAMSDLRSVRSGVPLVILDDRSQRPTLHDAFGTLLGQALALERGSIPQVDYLPSGDAWTEARVTWTSNRDVAPARFRLLRGRLVPSP